MAPRPPWSPRSPPQRPKEAHEREPPSSIIKVSQLLNIYFQQLDSTGNFRQQQVKVTPVEEKLQLIREMIFLYCRKNILNINADRFKSIVIGWDLYLLERKQVYLESKWSFVSQHAPPAACCHIFSLCEFIIVPDSCPPRSLHFTTACCIWSNSIIKVLQVITSTQDSTVPISSHALTFLLCSAR